MQIDQCREAFEKWARKFGTWEVVRDDDPAGDITGYNNITLTVTWVAWQAARSAPAVELPEPGATVFATQGIQEALASLIREAQDVADDCHRPRYTRLDQVLESARTALAAASNLSSGWVAVPVEPTEAMLCTLMQWESDTGFSIKPEYHAMLAAAPKLPQGNGWIPVKERLPKSGKPVLLDIGKKYPLRAIWSEKHTLEAGDNADDDWCDYDEANDMYYCPEGWYEWNEYEEIHWCVDVAPTHWMPLPQPPKEQGS